jgi:acyl-homoserine lactone synthase
MLEVVTAFNKHLYAEPLLQMHRLRHRIFVEQMGWEAIRRPDGVERDQFDTDDAVYLLHMDRGSVIGVHRLLSTLRPHLFSEVFAEHCSVRGVQRAPAVFELNRTCVDTLTLPPGLAEAARRYIVVGLIEFCVRAGIKALTVFGPLKILSHYVGLEWDIRPLGAPVEIDGIPQVAFILYTDARCLALVRQAYCVTESQVICRGMALEGLVPRVEGGVSAQLDVA